MRAFCPNCDVRLHAAWKKNVQEIGYYQCECDSLLRFRAPKILVAPAKYILGLAAFFVVVTLLRDASMVATIFWVLVCSSLVTLANHILELPTHVLHNTIIPKPNDAEE